MKRFLYSVLFAVLATAPTAKASSVFINFDDLTGQPVALTNQYASDGVVFDTIEATNSFVSNVIPPSAPNYATPFWNTTSPGAIEFVDPLNSATPAVTDSVTITMIGLTAIPNPGNFSGATIDALDIFGNVIAGQTQTINATDVSTNNIDLTFTGQIHELRFTQTASTNGVLPFDNLTFDSPAAVPEPSTALLLAAGFLGLAMVRNRLHKPTRL